MGLKEDYKLMTQRRRRSPIYNYLRAIPNIVYIGSLALLGVFIYVSYTSITVERTLAESKQVKQVQEEYETIRKLTDAFYLEENESYITIEQDTQEKLEKLQQRLQETNAKYQKLEYNGLVDKQVATSTSTDTSYSMSLVDLHEHAQTAVAHLETVIQTYNQINALYTGTAASDTNATTTTTTTTTTTNTTANRTTKGKPSKTKQLVLNGKTFNEKASIADTLTLDDYQGVRNRYYKEIKDKDLKGVQPDTAYQVLINRALDNAKTQLTNTLLVKNWVDENYPNAELVGKATEEKFKDFKTLVNAVTQKSIKEKYLKLVSSYKEELDKQVALDAEEKALKEQEVAAQRQKEAESDRLLKQAQEELERLRKEQEDTQRAIQRAQQTQQVQEDTSQSQVPSQSNQTQTQPSTNTQVPSPTQGVQQSPQTSNDAQQVQPSSSQDTEESASHLQQEQTTPSSESQAGVQQQHKAPEDGQVN